MYNLIKESYSDGLSDLEGLPMSKRGTVRIQIKDLPEEHWVELREEDVAKLVDGSSVELSMTVREVPSYAGLRWKPESSKCD